MRSHPNLFRQHVEPLISEAEAVETKDAPLCQVLETVRRVRLRLLDGTPG